MLATEVNPAAVEENKTMIQEMIRDFAAKEIEPYSK